MCKQRDQTQYNVQDRFDQTWDNNNAQCLSHRWLRISLHCRILFMSLWRRLWYILNFDHYQECTSHVEQELFNVSGHLTSLLVFNEISLDNIYFSLFKCDYYLTFFVFLTHLTQRIMRFFVIALRPSLFFHRTSLVFKNRLLWNRWENLNQFWAE